MVNSHSKQGNEASGWQLAVRSYKETLHSNRAIIGFIAFSLLEGPPVLRHLLTFVEQVPDPTSYPGFQLSWLTALTVIGLADARSIIADESLRTALATIISDTSSVGWIAINIGALVGIALLTLLWIEPSNPLGFVIALGLLTLWLFVVLPIHPFIAQGRTIPAAVSQGLSVLVDNLLRLGSAFATLTVLFYVGAIIYSLGEALILGGMITFFFGGFVLVPIGISVLLVGFALVGAVLLAYPRLGVYLSGNSLRE